MKNANFIDVISNKIERLPTLPGIAVKLLQEIQNPEVNLQSVQKLISADPALTSKLLKLVNSSFYSPRTPVTTIDHASKLLGLNVIKNLALSFCFISTFSAKPPKGFNLRQFWKDSLIGAIATKLLADKVKRDSSGDAFFLGLLQNIGTLVLACCVPDQYSLVLSASKKSHGNYLLPERQVFGLGHPEIGEYLMKSWALPEKFYLPVAHHHAPENIDPKLTDSLIRARILCISSCFIELFNGSNPAVSLKTVDQLLLRYEFPNLEGAAGLAKLIQAQAKEVFSIFEMDYDEQAYSDVVDAANLEMSKLTLSLVNELMEKNKEIEFLRAQTVMDGLTSLTNYRGFHELLEREISRAQRYKAPLSLIFGDIDFFKKINDTYGHLAGDYALRAIALCLKGELRLSDSLARYGGEEFGLILPETDIQSAFFVAERLRDKVQQRKISYKGAAFTVTMSFGVASLQDKGISAEAFIKLADDALYSAKRLGRNRCCMTEKKE